MADASERPDVTGPRETGEGTSPAHQVGGLDGALVRGVAWTAASKWALQLLSWGSTVVVARLLSPADYGLVTMASVFMGLVSTLSQFGVGATVVRYRNLAEEEIARIAGLCVVLGGAAFLVALAAAGPIARFYDAPAVRWIVVVSSISFLVTSVRTVPLALLQRDMQFGKIAVNEAVEGLVVAGASICMAWLGFRYWTLVLGTLLGGAVSTLLAKQARPQRIALPRLGGLREEAGFSCQIAVTVLAWYAYQNADFLVAGRILGTEALGAYTLAWTVATLPIEKVSGLLARVIPSVFSAVQEHTSEARRYLCGVTEGVSLVTVPASVGLALVAGDLVPVVFGAKWTAAVAPLQILCFYAGFRTIAAVVTQASPHLGLARSTMWMTILGAVALPAAFWAGSRWGTRGIAYGWFVGYPVIALPLFWMLFRAVDLGVRQYLRALWPSVSSTLVMAAGLVGVRALAAPRLAPGALLCLEVVLGAGLYAGTLYGCHRERVRVFLGMLRRVRGGTGL